MGNLWERNDSDTSSEVNVKDKRKEGKIKERK